MPQPLDPAPDGYLRVCWASTGPITAKWVGEGPEPGSKPLVVPRKPRKGARKAKADA